MKQLRTPVSVFLFATTACSATYRVSPVQYVPQRAPQEMVVVDKAGIVWSLEHPEIVGEKLVGVLNGTTDTVALPVARVEEATVRRKSPVRTAILVSGLSLGALGIAIIGHGKGDSCKLIYAQDDVPGKNSECDTSGI